MVVWIASGNAGTLDVLLGPLSPQKFEAVDVYKELTWRNQACECKPLVRAVVVYNGIICRWLADDQLPVGEGRSKLVRAVNLEPERLSHLRLLPERIAVVLPRQRGRLTKAQRD